MAVSVQFPLDRDVDGDASKLPQRSRRGAHRFQSRLNERVMHAALEFLIQVRAHTRHAAR